MICVLSKKYGMPKVMFFPNDAPTAEFFEFMNSASGEALEVYKIDCEVVTQIYPRQEPES